MPITDKTSKSMRKEHIEVVEQLNLAKYMHPEAPELRSGACLDCDLVGVIVHRGETFEGGHYFSYCRRQAADDSPGQWTKYDDEKQPAVPTSSAGKTASEPEVFQVEQILDHKPKRKKRTDRKVRILIKWIGYAQQRNSWEPYRNLKGAPDALKNYWAKVDSPNAPSPSLPPPEGPPASLVASQFGACPPPSTTMIPTPAHPTYHSPLPPAAAPTTYAAAVAPAPPLCSPGVVLRPPAPPHPKPTTTTTRSGSQPPAASSSPGLSQLKVPAAPTHKAPTKPLATSSSAALCQQPAPGASTQGPPTNVAAHHHQHGLKPMKVSADHPAMHDHPPPSPTVSSSSAVEKPTASKPIRSDPSMEDFPDSKPLWEIASELLQCRQHLGKKRKAPAEVPTLKTHGGLSPIPEAISSPAPKRSKVQHHTQAAGKTVAVAEGKRKRAVTASTKDTEPPAAKRQDSSDTAALPDKPGLRRSIRATNRKNYCEQDGEDTGMAEKPEVITKTEVPRRKRTTVGKKGIREPWR
ncbi:M-phase phosphoprotein 8 [Trebouxia sp. C0010 RCD-2024]